MITINDNDMPITVAEKLIRGTKHYETTPMTHMVLKALGSEDMLDEIDMFSLEELKEMAAYLIVYYEAHKDGD